MVGTMSYWHYSLPTKINSMQDEIMAQLANDLFNKRERLLLAGQSSEEVVDEHTAQALEAQYRLAEIEYREAKAVFARAMNAELKHA